jgi:Outer membrane protein beta-barrel domain
MKTVPGSPRNWRSLKGPALRPGCNTLFAVVLLAGCLITPRAALCQVAPSGDAGGYNLTVGATATGDFLEYGSRKMVGIAAIADLDTKRRIGIEGEAHWLMFRQTADVHTTTYLIGPRYHMTFGRFQPYAKGLIGFGHFNYPYNLGTDNDFVVAPGGGVDFRVTKRIRIRVADFEYQIWPQFHYGTLSSYGLSSGIRVRIF